MNNPIDIKRFDATWRARWPDCRPIGHELRSSVRDFWVRFHSLPESRRHARDDADYDELLARHFTLLDELNSSVSAPDEGLRVVTVSWSASPHRSGRPPALVSAVPEATHWQSLPYHLDGSDPVLAHLHVSATAADPDALRALLLLVADDGAADVIIGPPDLSWLYHPYDGGGDVIAPDPATRDRLRNRYADWLPRNPQGL